MVHDSVGRRLPEGTEDDRLERAILRALNGRVGSARRIARDGLLTWLRINHDARVSDREIRAAIERLRRKDDIGALICSSSGIGGYWLAENLDELLDSYREERRRCLTELVTIRERLRRGRAVLGGQLRML